MNACLTRLGIRPEIQEWLEPYYHTDENGNPCFSYGGGTETYGLAFHRVPLSGGLWKTDQPLTRQVIICSSAMEAISWLNCNLSSFQDIGQTMLAAMGSKLAPAQFAALPKAKYQLVFGNDLLGRICDLKAAAWFKGYPIAISMYAGTVRVSFRHKSYAIPCEMFSLHAFERISGFRFNIKTPKPREHSSWLSQLQAQNL